MSTERYVAYIGTYTKGSSVGIHILDLDTETNRFTERKAVEANNPSFVLVSNSGKTLYSTSDQGVNSYRITEDGDLEFMNSQWTGGMRGCYLETDADDRFLFVAGYYDGRISVMNLNDDGSVGDIADGVFHEGMGVDESGHDSMPHVTCVKLTPDLKGIFAVDNGLDQIKTYNFDPTTGKLNFIGVLRCELDSNPRLIRVDNNQEFIYVLCEQTNHVCVYKSPDEPVVDSRHILEPIQKISTIAKVSDRKPATFGMDFSPDGNHLFVSNTVTNTAVCYDVDQTTGMLEFNCSASLSGEYPRALAVLPDSEHFVVLGMNTGTVTVYNVNYDKRYFLMSAKPILIDKPCSICIHKLN